uniref:DUF7027 domain-containing protein n=1 Tax=Plectus sambesii TaxID=2011161 RepID=A0A914XB82_9BILA
MAEEDRCLCNVVHVKTGTWIIAIVQIIFAVLNVGNSIQYLTHDHKDDGARYSQYINFAIMVLWLLFIILLMVALYQNKASLMIPHLVTTVIVFILLVVNGVMLIISGVGLTNGIILIITVLIMFFLLHVEWRCYKYISAVGYA